jgi:3-methyladenine DNA glycosylase Mpg
LSLFTQNFKECAKALLGKRLHVGNQSAWIIDAQGYSRKENSTGIYEPMLHMVPGTVFIPRYRGGFLLLITCHDDGAPGGCVLLRAVSNGSKIAGPGRVVDHFGLKTHGLTGEMVEHDAENIEARFKALETTPRSSITQVLSAPKGIGTATLQKLMPLIAKSFCKKESGGFGEFVNELLADCTSEEELKRRIKS